MTDTFNGNTLETLQITKEIIRGTYQYEVTILCRTSSYSNYTTIAALAGVCTVTPLLSERVYVQNTGTEGTLVLAGSSHTYCNIKEISAAEISDSMADCWDYTVTFVRDTTT